MNPPPDAPTLPADRSEPGTSPPPLAPLAFWSLLLAVVLPCLPFVGFLLSAAALVQLRAARGRYRGSGLAIAAMAISLAVALLGLVVLLPAVRSSWMAAQQVAAQQAMERLVDAANRYEMDRGHYPANGYSPQNATPRLSWRVHLLPYLNERALYERFHLEEPWDSPHNAQLIPQIPRVYRNPSGNLPPGYTNYLAAVGPETAFPQGPQSLSRSDITDDPAQTILVVEVDADAAVPWTRPDDWEFDPLHPRRGLGGFRTGGFLAGFADGHARWVPSRLGDETLRALFTRGGGEAIDAGGLGAGP